MAVRLADDGDARGDGRQRPRPADPHIADLSDIQPVTVQGKAVTGEPDRLPVILTGPETRMADPAALAFPRQGTEPVPVGPPRILGCLHQCDRRHLGQPSAFRRGLGHGDDPALDLGAADLLPSSVQIIAQPHAVVEHHPRTPKRPGQHLLLSRPWVQAETVTGHHTNNVNWAYDEKQRGRLPSRQACSFCPAKVCEDPGAVLTECNGENDHVHLLVQYPPRVPVVALVNSLTGVFARRPHQRSQVRTHREHVWSPSHLAASSGDAPLNIIQAYIEAQRHLD
jgi:putative transposase